MAWLIALACVTGAAAPRAGQVPAPPALTTPERFTVPSDGHPMAVWGRRPAAPQATALLIHGRTWSARPDFDLQVPGLERSVLAALASRGIAAYAVDLRGYGETPRDATGWLTPRRSAADVSNVLAWIEAAHPGLATPAVIGWSRGAAIGMLAAQAASARLSALVIFGFAYDPDAPFAESASPAKPSRERNTAAAAASDFISPSVTPPAVVRAFVAQALRADPVLVDLRNDDEFDALDPARVTVPTLVIHGARDPGITPRDAQRFFGRLAARDKRLVVLAGADHAAHLEDTHDQWVSEVATLVLRSASSVRR